MSKLDLLQLANLWKRKAGDLDKSITEATTPLRRAELIAEQKALGFCAEQLTELFNSYVIDSDPADRGALGSRMRRQGTGS